MAISKTNASNIAKFYLSKGSMTPKKLQKILYFAYSWYMAIMNEEDEINVKLFDGPFEAWIHGPVYPPIYREYKSYRADMIPKIENFVPSDLNLEDIEVLENVWDVYGGYTANELESISHQHDPWKLTRLNNDCNELSWCNGEIKDELIYNYYVKQMEV
ncbi:TPA: Panacea domain-containing protein [Clostridium perfringens]|uniref:Panacea domain-containing protein n=1 Tax=Clostridium perfringens TaxID=1502 RepID=UPI000F5285FC|nr:type II toxin-antitoxin system antitoxin SocA domain-containing protein [Clostridium perfringens]MDK0686760.1 DUF4065 domain-containing protein [Clostridium perfringens]MDZ5148770.1 DUF4065 domain-containing protein [Clostridium perfringens]